MIGKPCFIDEIDISYCNNICRHLYLGQDCTIHDILDVRYNKYPFDSVPINNIMWQIILISFAKITCLFYIWFETYLVKVYLLGNYLPNLWVINLQIRMKMKETRASWRSFIRWIVSIYLRFFANKYFKKREIPASLQLPDQPAQLAGKVFAPAERVGKSEEKLSRLRFRTKLGIDGETKRLHLCYGGVVCL